MLDDGIALGVPFHIRDLHSLSKRLENEGPSFFQVTLPLLGRALEQGLVSGSLKTPTNFAYMKESVLPRLCYPVFRGIFDDTGLLLSEPNIAYIRTLRQFLQFDGKLVSEPTKEQESVAVQGFKNRMQNLRDLRIPLNHPVLLIAKRLLGAVLSRCDLSDINPGHGPGSVAEHYSREERWIFSAWPLKAKRRYPFYTYACSSSLGSQFACWPYEELTEMSTRICLVPKDFRGPRLISAEPTVNQYLQQGQMKSLMSYMSNHRLLSRSIRLNDQTFNQERARTAVADGMATLDLSDASDNLGVPLVWYLLSEVPKLRGQLMATRSDFACYKQEKIKIAAFAPMGSAVCFPVETLVFWALSMASVKLVRPREGWKRVADNVCVFGDDIIIPSGAELQTLIGTLESVGCKPNMSKTCWLTPFRESCGTEWYAGSPVSIIRNRRYHYAETDKFVHYNVFLELQRRFFSRGYKRTAQVYLEWAREIWPVFIYNCRQVDESSFSDGSLVESDLRKSCGSSPSRCDYDYINRRHLDGPSDRFDCAYGEIDHVDDQLPVRFNRDLQRLEYRAPTAIQRSEDWAIHGYARLTARVAGDSVERIAIRGRFKTKMAWRFLPAYRGVSSIRLV
jgi:hypothetical protein